jgi:hypothetical protein
MKRLLRSNPDVAAIAVAIALLVPMAGSATPNLSLIFAGKTVGSGLEVRAEKLWQRLEDRMKRFEDRFEQAAERRRPSEVLDYAAGE